MLDELVNTIETLKARISEHRTALQASEAQTRLSLIDPLLRVLGWDTADPALVRPEYTLSTGRADYALLGPGNQPVAIMEAKRLNEPLGNAEHRMQMLTYANFSNVAYAGLTDGDQWVFYRVFDQKPLSERVVLEVSIANEESSKAALKLLLLWCRNLESGQPIAPAEPIVIVNPDPPPPAPTPPDRGWVSLTQFVPTPGTKPAKLRLPGGGELSVTSWRDLFIELSEWLVRDRVLTHDKCPVSLGKSNAFSTVNLQPRHPNGKEFLTPHKLSNGLFLAPHGSAQDIIYRCRIIMEHLGKDPDSVHVQVG